MKDSFRERRTKIKKLIQTCRKLTSHLSPPTDANLNRVMLIKD